MLQTDPANRSNCTRSAPPSAYQVYELDELKTNPAPDGVWRRTPVHPKVTSAP